MNTACRSWNINGEPPPGGRPLSVRAVAVEAGERFETASAHFAAAELDHRFRSS
jgi:hypothetical protein